MEEGPNFAGHYRVAVWGCGSSCAMFAVINLKSGKVITAAGMTSVTASLFLEPDGFLANANAENFGLFRFRRDSSLLVVIGAPDEDESRTGVYYLVLRDDRLKLLHKTPISQTCEDAKQ
jgi:hypothetical protein